MPQSAAVLLFFLTSCDKRKTVTQLGAIRIKKCINLSEHAIFFASPRPNAKLEDRPLSAVRDWFYIYSQMSAIIYSLNSMTCV